MDGKQNFRQNLARIASKLTEENLARLKFLCDEIPAGDREKVLNAEQLFTELEQREKLAPDRLDFLHKLLKNIGRDDLATELKTFEHESGIAATNESPSAATATESLTSLAENHNERGRVEFKEGKFENARQQYTDALNCLPKDQEKEKRSKYFTNRAACYVNLRMFHDAHLDCDSALLLDPHSQKARYRLAQALRGEGKIAEAFMEVTSLYQKNNKDRGIAELESSLRKEIEDAKVKAVKKRGQGASYYLKKKYDLAKQRFSEAILLLPRIPENAETMMNLYWRRAECSQQQNNFEDAIRDCKEADRLYPEDNMVLLTKMRVLEKLGSHEECYEVCQKLIEKECQVGEAKKTIQRLLKRIDSKNKESTRKKGGCSQNTVSSNVQQTNNSKRSQEKAREAKKHEGSQQAIADNNDPDVISSSEDESLQLMQRSETESEPEEDEVDETFPGMVTQDNHSVSQEGATKIQEGKNTGVFTADKDKAIRHNRSQLRTTKGKVSLHKPIASMSPSVKSTSPESSTGSPVRNTQMIADSDDSDMISRKEKSLQVMRSGETESEPKEDEVDERFPIKIRKGISKNTADSRETICHSSSQLRTKKGKVSLQKSIATMSSSVKATSPKSPAGVTYPQRILLICKQWSSWYLSVCTVNRQLCRSFAKVEDEHVTCLVLDATEEERISAAEEGVTLIKAADQPGTTSRDETLLSLHSDIPFKVDLVVGHGMVSGAAAAIQAKRLNCKLLHVFHNSPIEEEDSFTAERDIAGKADFVAAVGPVLVEQWSMILNREIFMIIPGMTEVLPRNKIPTPRRRCLILGIMSDLDMGGLGLATDALARCKRQEYPIHLTVLGTQREMVHQLKKDLQDCCHSSGLEVVVKPSDVIQEIVEVEIRGVSLVLIPAPTDGFGVMALEALSAKVPILISRSSGLAKLLQDTFDRRYLKFVCSDGGSQNSIDAWSDAIDDILNNRDESFDMASSLQEDWNSRFTWDSTANDLLAHLGRSGVFFALSPSVPQPILPQSQCSDSALKFMAEEVDLLNRGRKHVLFLSPENTSDSPFIQYFAQVPWAAVFDFDENSVATGYLASCENFCENVGIKICRMLPPGKDQKKISVMLPNGIPWLLLEGMPERRRNIKENLEWIREFFMALSKANPGPITFIVLWGPAKEAKVKSKNLSKILTVVQGSPLHNRVKLAIACTATTEDKVLEDIADDWNVQVHNLFLEDICNALYKCVSSSPFIKENCGFALPVADPEDPQQVSFKVLPANCRWINAEMEVLYESVGSTPQFEDDDACHFYRGGLISWYALRMGYAVKRGNWAALNGRIQELLVKAGTMKLKMPHQRGSGGTTSARKLLFDYHEKYPCVFLKSVGHAEIAPAIKVLAAFCRLPVIILVDCKHILSDEFDVDSLYNSLSNDRIPCVILEVIHQTQQRETIVSANFEKAVPIRLADALTPDEAQEFVRIYSAQNKKKQADLNDLLKSRKKEIQIPFFYGLVTFEDRFTGLDPFVRECLQDLTKNERYILLFLAMAYHYGRSSLFANDFARLLGAPEGDVLSLEVVLPNLSRELLLEEDGQWRPRHDLLALEMLRQLLTKSDDDGAPKTHPDNWRNLLADKAMICFTHMSEGVVSDMLLSRVTDENSHQYFSQLISDIPFDEDAIRLFDKAISLFPKNPFFKVHLGRFYSIRKKSDGFPLAIRYTNEGIRCADNYASRVVRGQFAQMKGVVYSREVYYLAEADAEIGTIIERADEGVKNFRRAVSIAPDLVDGYLPEVRMMCKVFEHIDKTTGSFHNYVKSPGAHPFIIDAISNTSNTLECVPDSEGYSYWRMRLSCIGRQQFSSEKMEETLNLLLHLRKSDKASRGSINRQIVIMRMEAQSKKRLPIADIARELIELLNEALRHDCNVEQTMRLWVRLAPFIPIDLSESETNIFHWCSREKSVRSYLYKYIVACLQILGRGSGCYSEVMNNAKEDLNLAVKAINRADIGRFRHPDKPVVWLGREAKGMGNLVYLEEKITGLIDVRMKRFIDSKHTSQLRTLSGRIVETGNKVGTIRINGELDVSFRADLCETPLTGSGFVNRKVQFFLAFNYFGMDAYNVQLVQERQDF